MGAVWISLALVFGNAFFVAAEYGLVGARKSRVESLAKKGNKNALILLAALKDLSRYVAGIQIAITMFGIGIGAITEPLVTAAITRLLGDSVSRPVGITISILLVTYVLVVVGELVPKYVTLQFAERTALLVIRPLVLFVKLLSPLVWLVERSGGVILKLLRVPVAKGGPETASKEELMLLLRSGTSEGVLDEMHAQVVGKALRFDDLNADDIMVHRLDMKWIDIETPREQLFDQLGKIGHSRVPVCRDDLDHLEGLIYLQDVVRNWNEPDFSLLKLLRPVEVVPENLSLNRIVTRMREAKTQILVVVDEHGGTSGLITLEDVVEEVFGELDDAIESERPSMEWSAENRISARADVRYDELLGFLGGSEDADEEPTTDTLASILVSGLQRMPKLGDSVECALGTLRVENMARRRITRVSLQLPRGD